MAQNEVDTFSIFDRLGRPKLGSPFGMNLVQRSLWEADMAANPLAKSEIQENLLRQRKANTLYYDTGRKLAQEAQVARESDLNLRIAAGGIAWWDFRGRSIFKGAADASEKKAESLERQVEILKIHGKALEETGRPLVPNF